jgi:phosphoglycolate phosphatase/putative hydrolase of the HAD superfamily
MNNRAQVKGIIFDLDGTLYRMPWYMKPVITIRLFPHCLRLPLYMSIRETFAGKDMKSGENLMHELSTSLSRKKRKISPEQAKTWIFNHFYRQFEAVMPMFRGHRPGLSETLSGCKSKGIKLAVLSDFDKVESRLLKLDISPSLFDTLKAAEADGQLKPSPKPFLKIAESWNIKPGNILVIGDREDTDGLAANNAEMQFLQISDNRKKPENACSWDEIRSILGNLKNETSDNSL